MQQNLSMFDVNFSSVK